MLPWKKIKESTIFKNKWLKIDQVWFETAKGKRVDYYFVRGAPVVAVLGITTDKKIVLVQQYRPSTGKFMTDIPGGGAEDNESKQQAAIREFKEETGYDLDKVRRLTSFYFDSGRSDKTSAIYVGLATYKTDPKHDENESLKIIEVPYKILIESIRTGKITEPTVRLSIMSLEMSPLKKLYI
jgi:ADP-ribose pyrophosphatase